MLLPRKIKANGYDESTGQLHVKLPPPHAPYLVVPGLVLGEVGEQLRGLVQPPAAVLRTRAAAAARGEMRLGTQAIDRYIDRYQDR